MYKKIAYVDCYSHIKEAPIYMPFCKFLKPKTIKKKLLKKFPYTIETTEYLGEENYLVKLPIITSINEMEDEEYIKKVIKEFNSKILRYNINVLVLCEELKCYGEYFDIQVAKERFLGLLYISRLIKEVNEIISKQPKDIKYVILDGNNSLAAYIIDNIGQNINSLTLVTEDPQKYEEITHRVYNDSGLAIQVIKNNIVQEIQGDIIINCCREYNKHFYCWQKKAILVDFISNKEIIKDILAKRKDIKIIYDINVSIENKLISDDIVLAIMLNNNRVLRSFYAYNYRSEMKERILEIIKSYGKDMEFELLEA